MVDNDSSSNTTEAAYTQFWDRFRLFPYPWINYLLRHSRYLYLLFIVTFVPIIMTLEFTPAERLSPIIWRIWLGEAVIGWAELYLFGLGVVLVFWAYKRWMNQIPAIFEWLRQPPRRLHVKRGNFDDTYLDYLDQYQKRLLAKNPSTISSLSLIAILLLFAFIISGLYFGNVFKIFDYMFQVPFLRFLMIFSLIWSYLLGLAVWPLYVTVRFLQRLILHFHLDIQASHPDHCGGLQPLGDFCFSMSLPILLGSLALTVISVVGLFLFVTGTGDRLYDYFYLSSFDPTLVFASWMILVLFATPLLAISFFMPLWNIHAYMEDRKREKQDEFAHQAASLEQQIRKQSQVDGQLDQAQEAKDKLEIMQAINPNNVGFPVWPFRTSVVVKLFSTQLVSSLVGIGISVYKNLT